MCPFTHKNGTSQFSIITLSNTHSAVRLHLSYVILSVNYNLTVCCGSNCLNAADLLRSADHETVLTNDLCCSEIPQKKKVHYKKLNKSRMKVDSWYSTGSPGIFF